MINLYDDQQVIIDGIRAAMRKNKAVLCQSPTGSGKTVLTASMIHGTIAKGTRSMMVVPRRELLKQTAETFTSFGIPHSYVSAGYAFNPFEKTMLATAGSLARRLDKTPIPAVLFVDETHFGGAELDRIITHYKDAGSWIIGLSATPERLDGRGLGCWYDSMVQGQPVRELIKLGRLSKYRMFAPDAPDMTGIRKTAGDYSKGQLADRMEGDKVLVGNAVKHYRQHAAGLKNVCFCVSINHAEIVAAAFREDGISAQAIYGTMKDDERSKLVRAFARGDIQVLTSVDLLTFGFDLASAAQMDVTVECMSDLAPTQSLAKQMQKWGRVLRKKQFPAIILDHAGNAERHGLPDQDRLWSLEDAPKGDSDKEKADPIRQCDQCYFVHHPAACCPECGYVYPVKARQIEEVDGDLTEIDLMARALLSKKKMARAAQGRTETLEDLRKLAKETGKNARWADHVWKARQAKVAAGANR